LHPYRHHPSFKALQLYTSKQAKLSSLLVLNQPWGTHDLDNWRPAAGPVISMDFSACISDESFGPAVEGCRGDFDFTIKFERIIFMLIPTTIFIAISLPRLLYLIRRPVIVDGGSKFLQAAKLVRHVASVSLPQAVG
jgi:hypothetical protein